RRPARKFISTRRTSQRQGRMESARSGFVRLQLFESKRQDRRSRIFGSCTRVSPRQCDRNVSVRNTEVLEMAVFEFGRLFRQLKYKAGRDEFVPVSRLPQPISEQPRNV